MNLQRIVRFFSEIKGVVVPSQGGVPAGGTTGQALAKASGTDYDYAWAAAGGSPGGSSGAVQYNAAGSFDGFGSWDGTRLDFTSGAGTGNLFAGASSGNASASASQSNVAIGENALAAITTAQRCMAVGIYAFHSNTSGNDNVGVGVNASANATTGSSNTVIGSAAAYGLTTGSDNVAIGVGSLNSVAGGNRNAAVGEYAIYSTTGSDNVGLGYRSGFDNVAGANNTYLGANAGNNGSPSGLGYATAIGAGASPTASHQVMLGTSAEKVVMPGEFQPPTQPDAGASDGTLFFGSDHLDGSGNPKLCRKQGGTVTIIG